MTFIREHDKQALPDAELVQQYRQDGNAVVLGTLYQRYMELVFGVCYKYLKDAELAKDAVFNIYVELTQKLKKHEVVHFKSWLYTLARNHCLMQLRHEKVKSTVEMRESFMQSGELMHPDEVLQKEEQLNNMEQCMQLLPQEQRQCVKMFYLQQKCYNEICEATGFEWNKVRSYIQNARRNLKLCIEGKLSSRK
ncbi:MAG: RNA polymerase sigma factor [Chitinophagaceae bacterium]